MSSKLSDYDYHLPKNLIVQQPASPRDSSRLLVLNKKTGSISHHKFHQIDQFLNPGDIIVLNNTKVIPARLYGKKPTGGKVEILLLKKIKNKVETQFIASPHAQTTIWQTLTKPGLKENQTIIFTSKIKAKVIKREKEKTILEFNIPNNKFNQFLNKFGHTPLPPYINKKDSNQTRHQYQTIYAKHHGSAAAPTAGLHFTKRLIKKLKKKGIKFEYITLHVGLGTFQPVKTQNIKDHQIHSEYAEITKQTAKRLNQAKKRSAKIIACGTTTVRTLETVAKINNGAIKQWSNKTNLFITPGYKFKTVDAIITNFHLPKSSLLMLISAFWRFVW